MIPSVADALTAVNKMRRVWDKPTLVELPKGLVGDAHECPVARALDVYSVAPDTRAPYFRTEPNGPTSPLPMVLSEFATAFDMGCHPGLIEFGTEGRKVPPPPPVTLDGTNATGNGEVLQASPGASTKTRAK